MIKALAAKQIDSQTTIAATDARIDLQALHQEVSDSTSSKARLVISSSS